MADKPDPYNPHRPVVAKPVTQSFPTPNLDDRILVVRKDARLGGYKVPRKGSAFEGPDAKKFEGFVFATAKPADQTGWTDWFYLNVRANQDDYNFAIDYPYTDEAYPRFTRTYVLLRKDVVEPTADDLDPVYKGEPDGPREGLKLYLTDHKQVRLEDPVLDALFVGVQRVFERLPGPVITSYGQNEVKQVVTIESQNVLTETSPVLSDATTESLKIERDTTAKARVTRGRVAHIYPKLVFQKNWGHSSTSPWPVEFRWMMPNRTTTQIVAGAPSMPNLSPNSLAAHESQVTEFTKEIENTDYELARLVVTDFRVNEVGQIVEVEKILDPSDQTPSTGALIISSDVQHREGGVTIKETHRRPSVFPRLVAETEIPDLLPAEFRDVIPTVSEGFDVEGVVEDPPTLQTGEFKRRETQTTVYVKRVEITKRDLESLPRELIDQKLTEEYGGGILDVVRVVDVDVLTPDEGFDVVNSFVKHIGGGLMIKETDRVQGGVWPTLYDSITDDKTGIVVDVQKDIVPAGTSNPGGFTDMKSIDKWRTIQITSRINLTSLPPDETFGTTHNIDLPAQLLSVKALWETDSEYSSYHSNGLSDGSLNKRGLARVGVLSHPAGLIVPKIQDGYRGPAKAILVRKYLPTAPLLSQIPAPLVIHPVRGHAFIFSAEAHMQGEKGTGVLGSTYRSGFHVISQPIGPVLTGGYILENANYATIPVTVVADATGVLEGADETYEITRTLSSTARLSVEIPLSTPGALVTGQQFLAATILEEWRFKVRVLNLIYAYIP